MKTNKIFLFSMAIAFMCVMQSCQQPHGNSTGSEYMPDMGHSIAYEANHYNYYYYNTWGSEADYYKYAQPGLPVKGTVSRATANGAKPYYFGDTEEERTRAKAELIDNPLPITDKGLAEGKNLYTINCAICHGDKGDGAGYLARDGSPYPVQPANLLEDEQINSSNGRYYHAIMHGINTMGSYADKLGHDERWNVIHYIRSLQAKSKSAEYSQISNTLNSIDKPAGANYMAHKVEVVHKDDHEHMEGDGHGMEESHDSHGDEGHSHGEGHDDHDSHDSHGDGDHNH